VSDEKKFDSKKFADDLRDQIRGEINISVNGRAEKGERRRRGPVVIGIGLGKGSCQSSAQWGLIWGVIVALVGVVILLDNMGILAASQVFRFWPLLLIIAGVLNVTTQRGRIIGILLLGFGAALQLHELGIARFSWGVIWGLVWIAVGVLILWSSLEARSRPPAGTSEAGGDSRTRLNEMAIFGGVERRITTQDFQGGTINAIFGGVELDLSEAGMQKEEATIEVNAIFGGVEIRVPYEWQVVSRGAPIFGGYVDKTRLRRTEDPANTTPKILVLTGAAVFGGVEIKN
jgi:predicted membrane protein